MASNDVMPIPDDSDVELGQTPTMQTYLEGTSPPHSALSHRFRESSLKAGDVTSGRDSADAPIAVVISGPARPWEYQPFNGDTTVETILEKFEGPDGEDGYRIEYESGKTEDVSPSLPAVHKISLPARGQFGFGQIPHQDLLDSRISAYQNFPMFTILVWLA